MATVRKRNGKWQAQVRRVGHPGRARSFATKPEAQRWIRDVEAELDAAEAYRRQLARMGARPSMSRTACCDDNAPMESFFHTLKVELVHRRRWATRDDARRDLFADSEGSYNRQRIHSALGYLTPEQAERTAT